MDDRTVERVESWESRPLSGHGDLHRLAEEEFSGALAAGRGWLFMLNGRVVGVFGGDVEEFADATAYEAPDPALPLLFAMEETGGERRGEYYTGDTPLSEVDETLSQGSFTGYLRLSENVYSGDYYLVYYGGRAMPVGFVGNEERLVTGTEARESAEEEVGIYEVVSVSIDVRDVPEPEETGADAGAAAATAAAAEPDGEENDADRGAEAAEPADDAAADETEAAAATADAEDQPDEAEPTADTEERSDETETVEAATDTEDPSDAAVSEPEQTEWERDAAEPTETTTGGGTSAAGAGAQAEASPDPRSRAANSEDAVFEDEERWRQTRSIPALDPDRSEAVDAGEADGAPEPDSRESAPADAPDAAAAAETGGSAVAERVESLEAELADREQRIEELESRAEALDDERETLQSEVDRLKERIDDLTAERDRLQEQLDARPEAADAGEGDLAPEAALEGTNLFTRPETKSQPTLGDALDGDASAADARGNLSVTRHTEFDEAETTVAGEPYEQFLRDTIEYRFVEWVVTDLPFEIRDAGHESGLADLYDALPEIDRAQLRGSVEVEGEDGETVSRHFDVVLRDRMGEPLVVAEFNHGRDPVESGELESLVEDATAVAEGGIAAAFYVTASFFEPGALEATEEATKSGFLSRDSKESFVKVSRNRGFHLCLVESRDGSFYVNVPEL